LLISILLILTSSLPINAQSDENVNVTGVTVYRVYPFRPNDIYNIESIFFKNYSYKNYSLDLPWSTPFSFKPSQISNILGKLNNNSYVSSDSINVYFKDESSKNEYIKFSFLDSNYYCIIFPTMIIGMGYLTDTNEYISLSEMNNRRNEFLEIFENFIMEKPGFQFNLQQEEFLTREPLPRESMIWTRIIRVTQNFNTFSNEQIWDYLFYNTYNYEKIVSDDHTKMILISNIYEDYINEIVLFDGFKLDSWKTYYNYPLGLNENIIKLRLYTELNYVLLPHVLDEVLDTQEELDKIEEELIYLNEKSPNEIIESGIYEQLSYYKSLIRDFQHLEITIKLRKNETFFDNSFGTRIDNQYNIFSTYLNDIDTQYYFIKDSYNSLLESSYSDSASQQQTIIIVLTLISILVGLLFPIIKNWGSYRFSTPKFSVHFKQAYYNSYKETKLQEIKLQHNKQQLVWVMLHNDGKVIKHNWFCIIDFEKDFLPIPIESTKYKDVDYAKHYTVQKKYNAAHFNSTDFSPLFPYNETMIFPIVVKTPNDKGKYNVKITVFTGNHRNKFVHEMKIIIE